MDTAGGRAGSARGARDAGGDNGGEMAMSKLVQFPDLLPSLSQDEFEALKSDIQKRGIMVPIEIDADTGG